MASNIEVDESPDDEKSTIISDEGETEKERSFRGFRALSSARRLVAWVTVGKFGPG